MERKVSKETKTVEDRAKSQKETKKKEVEENGTRKNDHRLMVVFICPISFPQTAFPSSLPKFWI